MIEEESARVKEKLTLRKKYDIPVDNLSFEYVKKCDDEKALEKIIKILRSGEEGEYPDLLQSAEERLKVICPTNRLLIKPEPVRTPSSLNTDDRNKLSYEMAFWSDEIKKKEALLKEAGELKSLTFPPIRNYVDSYNVKKTAVKKKCSIKSLDYDAWDKYDPDKEILKMEIEEEREREEYTHKKEEKRLNNSLEPCVMEYENYSETEKQIFAEQEKDRGNECFKAGQYEEATQFYTKSLTILPNAVAYNNRAIANLKLKKYGEVITDCNEVLKVDPNNVKALFRRGNAHHCKGQLNEAMRDFVKVLEFEPTNSSAKSHISEIKKKLEETSEGKPKKARMIVDMKSFEEELTSIKIFDKTACTDTNPKPIPSTKKTCATDPMSFGDTKVNEWGYSTVMCNCNSIPRALQKKCVPNTKHVVAETGKNSIQIANKYSNQGNKSQTVIEGMEKVPLLIEEKGCDSRVLGCSSGDNRNIQNILPKDMPTLIDEDAIPNKGGLSDAFSNAREVISSSNSSENNEVKPMEVCESNDDDNGGMLLESPLSSYDFLRSWNHLSEEKNYVKHANLLKKIDPSNLSKVIGTELDGYMLSTMLKCLKLHFNNEEELLLQYLVSISNLSRFKAMWICLSPQEIEVARDLFCHLEQSGKCQVKEELKVAYGFL